MTARPRSRPLLSSIRWRTATGCSSPGWSPVPPRPTTGWTSTWRSSRGATLVDEAPSGAGRSVSAGGLSSARLARMHDVMAGYVERGDVPGLITLIGRRGEVHVDAIGTKAFGGSDPNRRDTIFRISSMTKPITAADTMILVEGCRLPLDEPVDCLLPEPAARKVLVPAGAPL